MTRSYAQRATWYWDALGETNQLIIDYLKSLTLMMVHANPLTVLTPVLRENGKQAAEIVASSAQQLEPHAEQSVRHTGKAVRARRTPAVPKATRGRATSAPKRRRTK